jgi:hypothetical protein
MSQLSENRFSDDSATAVGGREAPKKERIFPLHLTSFENYMLMDDRPRHPMTFIVQMEFSGALNQGAMEAAIPLALSRHPLLTAVIGPGKQGKDCWVAAKNSYPQVYFGPLDQPLEFADTEYIDLRREIGLRLFFRFDERKVVITGQFHHSSCDGIGSYQFLGDLLYFYALRTGGEPMPPLPELDAKELRGRGRLSYDMNDFRLPNGQLQRTWGEALKHLFRWNIYLRPPRRKPNTFVRPFPAIESHVFEKGEYKALRLVAQNRGQIINDLLLEELFQTLWQWRRDFDPFSFRRYVCVMMPLNLREEQSGRPLSVCNVVGHSFLRYSRRQMRDPASFRRQLAQELLQFKAARRKIPFMHMMAGGQYFYPKMLKLSLKIKRSLATAILSNTGDPTRQFYVEFPREDGRVRCGNLLLEDVSGVPPLRPGTNVTVSIFTYRRELKICMRCDPNQFSAADTRLLLDRYAANLRSQLL